MTSEEWQSVCQVDRLEDSGVNKGSFWDLVADYEEMLGMLSDRLSPEDFGLVLKTLSILSRDLKLGLSRI